MYHSRRVRVLGPSVARPPKLALGGMLHYASVVAYTIFLSEGRKMNFRVPYRSREILNVLHCFTLCISRPLYAPQKFIFWPEDKKIVFLARRSINDHFQLA